MKDYDAEKAAAAIGIDMQSMRMLLDMFAESLDEAVGNIASAVKAGDMEAMQVSGHKLKGSAANLGFDRLAELCRMIESGAKTGAAYDYAGTFCELEKEAGEIKAWHGRTAGNVS